MATEVRVPKNGGAARAFLTLLVAGGSVFFVAMGVLVSQTSELECVDGTQRCVRRTHYPFGLSFEEAVEPFQRVSLRVKSGRRGTSLNLTLHHAEGAATEYPGVGTNGDRAAETAEALRAYIAAPAGARTFPLRSGSPPLGIAMTVLGILGLALVPAIFNGVVFERRGAQLAIRIERRPLRAREVLLPMGEVEGVRVTPKTVGGRVVHRLMLGVSGRDPIDLGIAFTDEEPARQRAQVLEAQLSPFFSA